MRIGEICALRWKDIDLKQGVIYIRHTIQRISVPDEKCTKRTRIIIDEPKTQNSIRTIPLSKQIYPIIEKLHDITEESFLPPCSLRWMNRCFFYELPYSLQEGRYDIPSLRPIVTDALAVSPVILIAFQLVNE